MGALVYIKQNRCLTDSRILADTFGKRHFHVLATIRRHMELLPDWCSTNFWPTSRVVEQPNGGEREEPAIEMTYDGFNLVAMSFTTESALHYKIKFIEEFNHRGAELQKLDQPVKSIEDLMFEGAMALKEARLRAETAEATILQNIDSAVDFAGSHAITTKEILKQFPKVVHAAEAYFSDSKRRALKWKFSAHGQLKLINATTYYLKRFHKLQDLKKIRYKLGETSYDARFNRADVEKVNGGLT
jgi:Rha family phage regulatory protein